MKLVTDSGVDLCLPSGQEAELDIHTVPLIVNLEGRTYSNAPGTSNEVFYSMLESTSAFPITSQPSPGAFVDIYSKLAAVDPDILSLHSSSGLSGTLSTAQLAASMVPQANITFVDTKTMSIAAGWQVEAAAKAIKHGWPKDKALLLVRSVADATDALFTLNDMRYLIHGVRISHMKWLQVNLTDVKPIIGMDKVGGIYVQQGEARSMPQAMEAIAKQMERKHGTGSSLRAQIAHAHNPEGASQLRKLMDARFTCTWLPDCVTSLVLGAHAGPSVVGIAYAPVAVFGGMP